MQWTGTYFNRVISVSIIKPPPVVDGCRIGHVISPRLTAHAGEMGEAFNGAFHVGVS